MRTMFKAFEEKHRLITLLDQTLAAQGVQIIISPSEHFPEMQLSLVASSYGASSTLPWGAWGSSAPCAWIMPGWFPSCAIPPPWSPTCSTSGRLEARVPHVSQISRPRRGMDFWGS